MNPKNFVSAFVIIMLIASIIGFIYAATQKLIPTTGVHAAQDLEITPPTINWGIVNPNSSVQRAVDLRNIGNQPLGSLQMIPVNVQGLVAYTLTWDSAGVTLNPNELITATFTLTILQGSGTNFSFDIEIDWT